MKPKATPSYAQSDFFQTELSSIISLHHPLVRLSSCKLPLAWDILKKKEFYLTRRSVFFIESLTAFLSA